jgi:hypothetical protein
LLYIAGSHNSFEELFGNQNEGVERSGGSRWDDKGKLSAILTSLNNLVTNENADINNKSYNNNNNNNSFSINNNNNNNNNNIHNYNDCNNNNNNNNNYDY